ncbi:MAG: Gfo/Idh/MocA family oxidoreductase [Kiritimatiellae bacterium]|nr:Gfo/Idh/MocA family oxidoreductase [Kiritimatiellia bacterium]
MAWPLVVPAATLGRAGTVSPNERIRLAAIGIGGRGRYVLQWFLRQPDVQVLAVCDVHRPHREAAKMRVDQQHQTRDCAIFHDIRDLLACAANFDAALIAIGDRWHALAAVWAMRAGLDVYCEKPSSMTVAEGRAVVETATRFGRIYQTGTQRLSEPNHVLVFELARTGRLGRLHTCYAHIASGPTVLGVEWAPPQPEPAPEETNWDAWLGPCPWRPYNARYVGGNWRNDADFHTGAIGEWGAHTIAQCLQAIEPPPEAPVEIEPAPNTTGDGTRLRFANGVTMVLEAGRGHWRGACGEWIEGDEGAAGTADGDSVPAVSHPALLRESRRLLAVYQQRTGRALDHVRNFLDCIRSRERPVADEVVMHRSMSLVHAANIAQRLQRPLVWDPAAERFRDAPDANRFLSRAARAPWLFG